MNSGVGRSSRRGSVSSASVIDGSSETQTVGTLLAAIATCMTDSLRILMFADKRQWGSDEFEQTRVLEEALDEAKKDFQEMGPLVHGQFYYENDRTPESLQELSSLLTKFEFHAQNFKDWARHGGPINPVWARETVQLRRDLHRAQCRAARRIFATVQDGDRCLGAFQVYRQQKRNEADRQRRQRDKEELPPWQREQQQQQQQQRGSDGQVGVVEDEEDAVAASRQPGGEGLSSMGELLASMSPPRAGGSKRRGSLEELVPRCNAVGRFQRLEGGSQDAAFVCDFCDGYIVWPDLRSMPSERMPLPPTAVSGYPHWQANGISAETGEEKTVVFAPLAIANHMPPEPGDWQAALMCPYCEEDTYLDEGEDSSELKYVQDEKGFPDLEAFRAHLEWYHTAMPVPPLSALASKLPSAASNCRVM
ncbi:hypothetical protein C8A03DRAFT_30603 [Achaetomium macrosporum]|uniref:Uncharacterized protein n=1 Tax=Achaetomium macrosporum TaxID=79813 RepID=A0AAN7CFR1_9PEZI|nr:hypothetical protein C8A03DRAFT_30603 [Achaetomium macrosporum]